MIPRELVRPAWTLAAVGAAVEVGLYVGFRAFGWPLLGLWVAGTVVAVLAGLVWSALWSAHWDRVELAEAVAAPAEAPEPEPVRVEPRAFPRVDDVAAGFSRDDLFELAQLAYERRGKP